MLFLQERDDVGFGDHSEQGVVGVEVLDFRVSLGVGSKCLDVGHASSLG